MNDLEVREERHLSVEEFYEVNGIPEKEREEFEFIAGALTISALRTMKEAFKIGGYAWHAHKRFEAVKDGWNFNKTVEWLETIGIRYSSASLRRFINVYATYHGAQLPNATLAESYKVVNTEADEVASLPDSRIKIIGNLFRALPSDDTTNPKELIRELIRAGKVDIEEFTPELATKFRREAEKAANKIKQEAEAERKRIEEEKSRLNDTIKQLSRQIAEIKKEAKDEVSIEFHGKLKELEDEKVKLEKEVKRLEDGYEDMEDEAMRSAKLAEQKEKQLEEIQKKYEEILADKEAMAKKEEEFKKISIRSKQFEEESKKAKSELRQYKSGELIQKKIATGLSSLDIGISNLGVLRGEASNMSANVCKFLKDELQERVDRINFIINTLFDATVIEVKEDNDE